MERRIDLGADPFAHRDVGLGQTIMFDTSPPKWGAFLPARGASRVLIDGAFTAQFDEVGYLLLGMAWLASLTAATIAVFHRRHRLKDGVNARS